MIWSSSSIWMCSDLEYLWAPVDPYSDCLCLEHVLPRCRNSMYDSSLERYVTTSLWVWKLPLLDWIRRSFEVGTIGWMLGNNRWHAICIVSGCYWNRVVTNTRLSCMCLIDPASPHWHDESSRSHHQDNICGRRCYRVRLHTLEDVPRVQDGQTNKEYC